MESARGSNRVEVRMLHAGTSHAPAAIHADYTPVQHQALIACLHAALQEQRIIDMRMLACTLTPASPGPNLSMSSAPYILQDTGYILL